jgi:hypothetical protein
MGEGNEKAQTGMAESGTKCKLPTMGVHHEEGQGSLGDCKCVSEWGWKPIPWRLVVLQLMLIKICYEFQTRCCFVVGAEQSSL